MYKYVILFLLTFSTTLLAETIDKKSVDCLILQDENSIICKYEHERLDIDQEVQIQWIAPSGEISRERTIIIPAGHGSIYDFRYIEGREKGIWQFKIKENNEEFSTTFTIE